MATDPLTVPPGPPRRPGLPPPIPPCPAGWLTGPPDFVGVGVQRAGTTRWYRMLLAHPGVTHIPESRKEVHYFERFWHDGGFSEDVVETYHRYFPRPEGSLVGEFTPRYMFDSRTPGLLAAAAPEARLLAILRDPIERYRSHMARYVARHGSERPIDVFVETDAVARGDYAQQLARVLRHFPREQLLVLQFERTLADPRSQLRRTYEFLGLDADFVPEGLEHRFHPGTLDLELPTDLEADLAATYALETRALLEIVPDLDLDLWPRVRDAA